MVEFFEDMLDTFDFTEGSGKEDIWVFKIRLIVISFEIGTLDDSVYIFGYSELFQHSLRG